MHPLLREGGCPVERCPPLWPESFSVLWQTRKCFSLGFLSLNKENVPSGRVETERSFLVTQWSQIPVCLLWDSAGTWLVDVASKPWKTLCKPDAFYKRQVHLVLGNTPCTPLNDNHSSTAERKKPLCAVLQTSILTHSWRVSGQYPS